MKKLVAFFATLFNQKQSIPEKTTQEVFVNSYSQPHVLQQRMKEEKLTHGQTVKADLSPVRLEYSEAMGKTYMYFCPMQLVNVKEIVSNGDGGRLPGEVILKGIEIDKSLIKPGLYTLKNVTLFSNGTLQVIANEDTKFEPFVERSCFDRMEQLRRAQFHEQQHEQYLRGIMTSRGTSNRF